MAHLLDFKTLELNTKQRARGGPSEAQSGGPRQAEVDQQLHRKIEALIPRMTRYARVLTRDVVAADDLVQDCLARALGKIHLWEQGTDLRAWLFTILHHQHISLTRRTARQRATIELQKCTPGLTPSPNQTERLELRDVERAIAKLPEEQRSVILLVGLEGMRYDAAAAVVNVPVGTVRSRVSRGRQTLRTMTGLFPGPHSRPPSMAAKGHFPPRRAANGNDFRAVPTKPISTSTGLMGAQPDFLQQDRSGLGRQEQAIGR
jgi:RNA polymerase sigma-70 factor (ECF subfamily)